MNKQKKNNGLSSTFKSLDTEENIDIYFYRPIGYQWAKFFNYFNIHPNVITILSIFIGAAAGICFYFQDFQTNLLGVFLLIWANSYDSADGQLARMTGKKTQWGRILDGFAGDVWFFAIYAAICLRLMPIFGYWIWLVALVTGGYFHARQCQLADYYRNIHLFFLKGEEGSELDSYQQQRKMFNELLWKEHFWWKLFLYFYGNYTHIQEKMTPKFQRFFKQIKNVYPQEIPQIFRDEFRGQSKPLMKYTNILTFNTRAIALFISVLINEPWLYFLFELTVLNGLLYYMRYRHEQMCQKFYQQLTQ